MASPACGARLLIAYTNDLHARLDRLASAGEIIATARAAGDPVLLVDAGDAWQDFRVPVYAVWGADRVVEWMNRAGYDAQALGNHDLYLGWQKVRTLALEVPFPILSANLRPIDETASPFAASARIARGELDVLVVGLAAIEQLPLFDFPWLRLHDPVDALQREIDEAPGTPDLVVCVAHIPLREAERIAALVPGIGVFVTGHSHALTPIPRAVGQTLIVQSGAFGRHVGLLTVDVERGAVRLVDNALVPTSEQAATDIGRGLVRLVEIALGILAFCCLLAL
jgi:2',3'-cyclic-nucleotide 2'-phosphodiesterase (5'-nucleotidase family)